MKDKAFHAHWRHLLDIKAANLEEIFARVCVRDEDTVPTVTALL